MSLDRIFYTVSFPLKRRSLRIFGCPQETTDGSILGDGCNQPKSAFAGVAEVQHTLAVLNCRRENVRCFALLKCPTGRQSFGILHGLRTRFGPAHALKLLYFNHAKALRVSCAHMEDSQTAACSGQSPGSWARAQLRPAAPGPAPS